jgi:hypothetical protein
MANPPVRLESPVTLTDDAAETRRLATLYCSAVDDGDAARMSALFQPPGRLLVYRPGDEPGQAEPLRRWEGEKDFARLISVLRDSYERWVHFLGNHWVEVDGDRAAGEAYLIAFHLRRHPDGTEEEEVSIVRYQDSYVRTDEGWRFVERHARRQWTTVRPVSAERHVIDEALHGNE